MRRRLAKKVFKTYPLFARYRRSTATTAIRIQSRHLMRMYLAPEALKSYELVSEFFKRCATKTHMWFQTANPQLGGLRPDDLILLGRAHKLLQFVENSLAANARA